MKANDHENVITAVDINPQETLLATAGGDKNVNVYSIPQSKLLTSLSEHTNWVRDVTFNIDGSKLISCGDDGHAIIRNITNLQNIRVFSNNNLHSGILTSVDVLTDNKSMMYGSLSGKINVQCERVCYKASVSAPVNKVKFTPNNSNRIFVAIATQGAGVILMDAIDMKIASNDK
jgi:WD40 repeat protein